MITDRMTPTATTLQTVAMMMTLTFGPESAAVAPRAGLGVWVLDVLVLVAGFDEVWEGGPGIDIGGNDKDGTEIDGSEGVGKSWRRFW